MQMAENDPDLKKQIEQNEKIFNHIFDKHQEKQRSLLEKKLSSNSKVKVDLIVSLIKQMNEPEKQYYRYCQIKHLESLKNQPYRSVNIDAPEYMNHPPTDLLNQEYREQFQQYQSGQFQGRSQTDILGAIGVGGSAQQIEQVSNQEQEVQKEQVKEQTNFDVELVSIDSSAKIKIIKEVRVLCQFGLKEAKEAVEKLPNVLLKQATKDDANKAKETLEKIGCTIILK